MERRRLMRPLDDYIHSITQSPEDVASKTQFYSSIRHFYRKKWGCPLKVPSIHGVELDLHLLYNTVISLGGWSKVCNHERWPQVLHELGIDEDVQVAEHAVRMLYMRFLSKYEQAETGNDPDEHDSDLMGSRSRMKGHLSFASSEAPTSVPKTGMAQEYTGPEYHKILKSLLSGLPNEVDFGVNVCSLLSHPGPYLLRLGECPQLMTALVAHCCIFNDGPSSLEDLHFTAWQHQSTHDFATFWTKAGIEDTAVLSLISHTSHSPNSEQIDFEDDRLDLKNSVNWRVFQILSIFRNLSFEECNKCSMASNLSLMKFLLICCNSKWQQLVNGAFDILSNIASEINLTMEGTIFSEHLLLKTVSMGLFSDDKFQILRAVEIFTGLCNNNKHNEMLMCEFAEEKILSRIFTLVTAKDILLCIVTLESLYQMSELGRNLCEVLSSHNRSIDILVDLATTDAASFGSSGLAGIKVVEIHGHTGQLQPYHPQRSNHSIPVPLMPVRPSSPANRSLYSSPPPPSSPSLVRHHFAPPPSPLAVVRPPLANIPSGISTSAPTSQIVQKLVPKKGYAMAAKIHTVTRTPSLKTFVPAGSMSSPPPSVQEVVAAVYSHAPPPSSTTSITNQGQESKLEKMTKSYIHEHCAAEEKAISNRGEMYAHYVEYMQSHDMLSGSLQMFINQLKACFPSIIITHSPGSSVHSVEGIRFTKVVFNGNSHISVNLAAQHPLMQQMLSSPTLNGHVDSKDILSDLESSSILLKTEAKNQLILKPTDNNNQKDCLIVNGHMPNQEAGKLNNIKEWKNQNLSNGTDFSNEFSKVASNGNQSKILKADLQLDEEDKIIGDKHDKLVLDEDEEEQVVKSPKASLPNGLVTPVLRGRKRGSTNGASKSWSKKPKAMRRTSTSSSLSSETTASQTPVPVVPVAARMEAVIDAAQPSTSAPAGDYMCEWDCCGRFFHSSSSMLYHNTHQHLNNNSLTEERQEEDENTPLICKWPSCDGTPRSKWSMVTHLQDHHCTEHQLQASLRTRREMGHYNYMVYLKQQLEKVKEISHHPGYSKFAAVEAIRRHAFSYMTKDLTDDSEGPVTRSIRLTSSLILRNIAKHSVEGRRKIRKHESHLSWMALSRMESSAALAQCLGELAEHSALGSIPEIEMDE